MERDFYLYKGPLLLTEVVPEIYNDTPTPTPTTTAIPELELTQEMMVLNLIQGQEQTKSQTQDQVEPESTSHASLINVTVKQTDQIQGIQHTQGHPEALQAESIQSLNEKVTNTTLDAVDAEMPQVRPAPVLTRAQADILTRIGINQIQLAQYEAMDPSDPLRPVCIASTQNNLSHLINQVMFSEALTSAAIHKGWQPLIDTYGAQLYKQFEKEAAADQEIMTQTDQTLAIQATQSQAQEQLPHPSSLQEIVEVQSSDPAHRASSELQVEVEQPSVPLVQAAPLPQSHSDQAPNAFEQYLSAQTELTELMFNGHGQTDSHTSVKILNTECSRLAYEVTQDADLKAQASQHRSFRVLLGHANSYVQKVSDASQPVQRGISRAKHKSSQDQPISYASFVSKADYLMKMMKEHLISDTYASYSREFKALALSSAQNQALLDQIQQTHPHIAQKVQRYISEEQRQQELASSQIASIHSHETGLNLKAYPYDLNVLFKEEPKTEMSSTSRQDEDVAHPSSIASSSQEFQEIVSQSSKLMKLMKEYAPQDSYWTYAGKLKEIALNTAQDDNMMAQIKAERPDIFSKFQRYIDADQQERALQKDQDSAIKNSNQAEISSVAMSHEQYTQNAQQASALVDLMNKHGTENIYWSYASQLKEIALNIAQDPEAMAKLKQEHPHVASKCQRYIDQEQAQRTRHFDRDHEFEM